MDILSLVTCWGGFLVWEKDATMIKSDKLKKIGIHFHQSCHGTWGNHTPTKVGFYTSHFPSTCFPLFFTVKIPIPSQCPWYFSWVLFTFVRTFQVQGPFLRRLLKFFHILKFFITKSSRVEILTNFKLSILV